MSNDNEQGWMVEIDGSGVFSGTLAECKARGMLLLTGGKVDGRTIKPVAADRVQIRNPLSGEERMYDADPVFGGWVTV